MRKILIYLILLFATSLMASEVKWVKDYNAAIVEASKSAKPILFISSRHSCKYCVILDETTLRDARVVEALNKDFVSAISYSDNSDFMPQELYHPGTPAIWFLLSDGQPMYQPLMGAIDAENFIEALSVVKKEFEEYKKAGK